MPIDRAHFLNFVHRLAKLAYLNYNYYPKITLAIIFQQ